MYMSRRTGMQITKCFLMGHIFNTGESKFPVPKINCVNSANVTCAKKFTTHHFSLGKALNHTRHQLSRVPLLQMD